LRPESQCRKARREATKGAKDGEGSEGNHNNSGLKMLATDTLRKNRAWSSIKECSMNEKIGYMYAS